MNDPYENGIANGKVGVWTASSLNLDNYPHAHDFSWENMAVEIDLTTGIGADVVKVFRDDVLISTPSTAQKTDVVSFLNDDLYIGARGGTGVFLTGWVDELKIESVSAAAVPEPGIAILLFVAGGLATVRRTRKP